VFIPWITASASAVANRKPSFADEEILKLVEGNQGSSCVLLAKCPEQWPVVS